MHVVRFIASMHFHCSQKDRSGLGIQYVHLDILLQQVIILIIVNVANPRTL